MKKICTVIFMCAILLSGCGDSVNLDDYVTREDYDAVVEQNNSLEQRIQQMQSDYVSKEKYDEIVEQNNSLEQRIQQIQYVNQIRNELELCIVRIDKDYERAKFCLNLLARVTEIDISQARESVEDLYVTTKVRLNTLSELYGYTTEFSEIQLFDEESTEETISTIHDIYSSWYSVIETIDQVFSM